MPEIIELLTDDHGTITHLVTEEQDRISVQELAEAIDDGEDYYVTFGDEERFGITIVADEDLLEPTVDDPSGEHSIWDLPQAEDPEESEIEEMFDELTRMGEIDEDEFGEGERPHSEDLDDLK